MINLLLLRFDSLIELIAGLSSVIFVFKYFILKYYRELTRLKKIKSEGILVYGKIVDIKVSEDFDTAKVYFPIIEYFTNNETKIKLSETHFVKKPIIGEKVELILNETTNEVIDNISIRQSMIILWLLISCIFVLAITISLILMIFNS